MANIAVLVPRDEMLRQTQQVAQEENIPIRYIKVIQTPDAVQEARTAITDGANIIVARGLQAYLIKMDTNIPVVEIRLTGQELGLLVLRAKELLKKERPHIAVIGYKNTYSSMRYFEQLYDIKLSTFYVTKMDELHTAVAKARKAGAELVIGGDVTIEAAEHLGMPSLFNEATEESIREALFVAAKAGFAIDVEKQANSQLDSILETSLDGIIRLDKGAKIVAANQVVKDVLGFSQQELLGRDFEDIMPFADTGFIKLILSGEERRGNSLAQLGSAQVRLTAAPVEVGGGITGAIVTLHQMGSVSSKSEARIHDMFLNGFVASANFSRIPRSSKKINRCIELAKMYALSRSPVVIYGEVGTEKETFAQTIHNNSARRNQPYVSVSCFEASEEKQAALLFGRSGAERTGQDGALLSANSGSVHITDIHNMTPQCQYRLYRLISQRILIRNDINKAMSVDVRIIASTDKDLVLYVQKGTFRKDLYYQLQALVLTLPPLRENPEEIAHLAEQFIKKSMERYSKYIVLSGEALAKLEKYPWEGNLIQLEQFCEMLVLTANRRTLDEGYVGNLLSSLFPVVQAGEEGTRITVYRHPEALRIAQLLEKHNGSRSAVAEEMGISTTTLWRHMKKYGVGNKYTV